MMVFGNVVFAAGGNDIEGEVSAEKSLDSDIIYDNGQKSVTKEKKIQVHVDEVLLDKHDLSMVEGESVSINATIIPENADDKSVRWDSSNSTIAMVDSNGRIVARKEGSVIITATSNDGGKFDSCKVYVAKKTIRVANISLSKTTLFLMPGEEFTLEAFIRPNKADDKSVLWKSDDPHIASVSENGQVSANKPGRTIISATSNDGALTAYCDVIIGEIEDDWYEDYTYSIKNNRIIIMKYNGTAEKIYVPNKAVSEDKAYDVELKGGVFSSNTSLALLKIFNGINLTSSDDGNSSLCMGCTNLKKVDLPANMNRIGNMAFKNCTALEELNIPNKIELIGDEAFYGCDGLKRIYYDGNQLKTIKTGAFRAVSVNALPTCINTQNDVLLSYDWRNDNREAFREHDPVESISMNITEIELEVGETESLEYSMEPESTSENSVVWKSSDESVVKVDENGKVTALKLGTSIVSIFTSDGEFTDSCCVTVVPSTHFEYVREGEQTAVNDNRLNPHSAWITTSAEYGKIYGVHKNRYYKFRLEEMYRGKSASKKINNEYAKNQKASSTQEWLLFKFYIHNDANEPLEADDLINTGSPLTYFGETIFYNAEGNTLKIYSTARFENDLQGQGIGDVIIQPGQDGYCWIGILTDKTEEFPYLSISNGCNEVQRFYTWLNTDPEYYRPSDKEEENITDDIYLLYKYLKGRDSHEIVKEWKKKDASKEESRLIIKYNDANYRVEFTQLTSNTSKGGSRISSTASFYYDLNSEKYSVVEFDSVNVTQGTILYQLYTESIANLISPHDMDMSFNKSIISQNPDHTAIRGASSFILLALSNMDGVLKSITGFTLSGLGFENWGAYSYVRKTVNTVELYVDGDLYDTIQVKTGDTIGTISDPVSEGTFVGWYNENSLWDLSAPVLSDMILTARFINLDLNEDSIDYSYTAIDTQPHISQTTERITLVKGQKFILGDGIWESTNKACLPINKKGVAIAKKTTNTSLGLVRKQNGQAMNVYIVDIIQPTITRSLSIQAGSVAKVQLSSSGGLNVTWASSAPDIACVSSDGEVYGISKGKSEITATINGVVFKCKVRVSEVDTSKRDFQKVAPIHLVPMQNTTIKVKGFKASNAIWSSDKMSKATTSLPKGVVFEDEIVRITKDGKVTAIGSGTTSIKANAGNKALSFTVDVSEPVTRIIHMNSKEAKTVKIYGIKGSLPWKESDRSVAQIYGNRISALKPGTTTLTAKYENFEYKVEVYVEDSTIITQGITGKYPHYNLTVIAGKRIVLNGRKMYQRVVFHGTKNHIVFVDEGGILTARNRRKASITTKVNGKKITLIVNVI